MKENYQPDEIEKIAQEYWQQNDSFKANIDQNKEKFYCLSMFPYPSGNLHIGHIRNYTISDVIARFQKMQGKNVLHPMGWDAFGLPAENAAIKNKCNPADWTYKNIDTMKVLLKKVGFGYDWNREITTCDPEYYKWEQWFFTKLYEKGLAYKKLSHVNWCPNDKTVLANEQVEDGKCWRCDTKVELKELSQWFIKITAYAEELLADLDTLDHWPEKVKTMQRNWIGKSEGTEVEFIVDSKHEYTNIPNSIKVFTTRVDTLMGVACLAISPEHPISNVLANEHPQIKQFISDCMTTGSSEAELAKLTKKGITTNINVIHPITKASVPLWIANFVLMGYGSGAVMTVPAHDQRDFEFATKYNISFKQVVTNTDNSADISDSAFTDLGILCNSGEFDNLTSAAAKQAITSKLTTANLGEKQINYRLRDWGVSRQRHWGVPIPMLYLEDESIVSVKETELPINLSQAIKHDDSTSSLTIDENWKHTSFNNAKATRETDTFDTFIESSWYYAKYCSTAKDQMLDPKEANYWLPVDQYIGGIEHAVMHLLYARFFHKLLRDTGLVASDEPFKKLLCQGMVVADSYYKLDKDGVKDWISPSLVDKTTCKIKATGEDVTHAGISKMSKSKNNGVDPKAILEKYGADTLRLYTMFAAPAEQSMEWSENALEGSHRFLRRFYSYAVKNISINEIPALDKSNLSKSQREFRRLIHKTIEKVSTDFDQRLSFNTGIAAIMELNNELLKFTCQEANSLALAREAVVTIIKLLAPIAPHISHYLWQKLPNNNTDIINAPWPTFSNEALAQDISKYAIQVNGKLRASIEVSVDLSEEDIKQQAISNPNVNKHIGDKAIKRIIFIPKKLINIVV
jgi:leucyl-tRNA synthetase